MPIAQVDFSEPAKEKQFVDSIKQTGFAVIKNHDIAKDLIQRVFNSWQRFFEQEEEAKHKYLFKRNFNKVQDGFFPKECSELAKGSKNKDPKEFFHYYPCTQNFPKEICEQDTFALRQELMTLAKELLSYLERALPKSIKSKFSMPLSEMIDEEYQTLLRILHYPSAPPEIKIRAAEHTDINLITLLVSPSAPGLQALDTSGHWHMVPCEENCITVNIGDMLEECSEFYYPSTKHRVINLNELCSRYSIPLFLHAKDEVVLSKRYTAKSYRLERLAELDLL